MATQAPFTQAQTHILLQISSQHKINFWRIPDKKRAQFASSFKLALQEKSSKKVHELQAVQSFFPLTDRINIDRHNHSIQLPRGQEWKNSPTRPLLRRLRVSSAGVNEAESCSSANKVSRSLDVIACRQWQSFGKSVVSLLLVATLSQQGAPSSLDTFENVPQSLSGDDLKPQRIQRPKSAKAETCTRKCVSTCIRGGAGAPGEGPFNVRRPLVVFKEGFRSRQYCLIECSDICNLIDGQDDGP